MQNIVSEEAINRRSYWINEVKKLSGNFGHDYSNLENELTNEVKELGDNVLIDHLRLCGSIPESYKHDSSEEKLYSKYTDCLLSEAYNAIGFKGLVLTERASSADIESFGTNYSFIADTKAFRLSRTTNR